VGVYKYRPTTYYSEIVRDRGIRAHTTFTPPGDIACCYLPRHYIHYNGFLHKHCTTHEFDRRVSWEDFRSIKCVIVNGPMFCSINPYWKLSLVFKCLTDSIMLDDFKTELRKLGFARMQREKEQQKSSAIAHKDSFVDGQEEIEHALHTNDSQNSMNLGEMLTSDEQFEAQREARRRSSKPILGRMGKKISHLPTSNHNGYQRDPWIKNKENN
jgi:hypothetical protein